MRPVGAALFHADGQTYRRVEANSRFWQNSVNTAAFGKILQIQPLLAKFCKFSRFWQNSANAAAFGKFCKRA